MPKTKNQAKNKSRFEVRGGLLNEYEFSLNEGAMTEEERNRFAQAEEERQLREGEEEGAAAVPMSPQEREAARIREVMETAHEKAQRNIERRQRQEAGGSKAGAGKKAAGRGAKGAGKSAGKKGAKKSARKSAKKSGAARKGATAAKGAAKKGAGKRGAAKKGGAKKSAAKKSGAKKSVARKGGRSSRK